MNFRDFYEAVATMERKPKIGGPVNPPHSPEDDGGDEPEPDWYDVFIKWMDTDNKTTQKINEILSQNLKPKNLYIWAEPWAVGPSGGEQAIGHKNGKMVVHATWNFKFEQLEPLKSEVMDACNHSALWHTIVGKPASMLFFDADLWRLFLELIIERKYRQQPLLDFISYIQGGERTAGVSNVQFIKTKVAEAIKNKYKEIVDSNNVQIKSDPQHSQVWVSRGGTDRPPQISIYLVMRYWVK